MKLRWILFLLIGMGLSLCSPSVHAQGFPIENVVWNQNGFPVSGASITVCAGQYAGTPPCTSPATIYSDLALTQPIPNPITTGSLGDYRFVVAAGVYTVSITASGAGLTPTNHIIVVPFGSGSDAALKPAASDAVRFVSPNGSAANDGLSWGSALWGSDAGAAINAAYASLPASGGEIKVAGLSASFSTPIVFGTNGKPVDLECTGSLTSNAVSGNTATTLLNYTPTTGTAMTFNTGVGSSMERCSLQGPATGTAVGVQLGGTNGFIFSHLDDNVITGFPGGGLVFGNNTYIDTFNGNIIHDNGLDLSFPSVTTSGENLSFTGGAITEKGSGFSTTCANISGTGFDGSFIAVSFDQCGLTVSGSFDTVSLYADHFENPNGVTNLPFITNAGTQALVHIYGGKMIEDSISTGRTEFILGSGNAAEVDIFGGQYQAAETVAQVLNLPAANESSQTVGMFKINFTNFVGGVGGGFFSGFSANRGQFAIGPGQGLTLQSTGGGSITHQAPNTASNFTITDPAFATTLTGTVASGTATMTTGAIGSGACGATVTVSATGTLTTDTITYAFNAAVAANPGELTLRFWPTTGNVNFEYCNPTAGSITPTAATLNWRVVR